MRSHCGGVASHLNSIEGPQLRCLGLTHWHSSLVRGLLMYLALSSISSATGVAPLFTTTKASSCVSGRNMDVTCSKVYSLRRTIGLP